MRMKIYIANLLYEVTEADLTQLFDRFDPVDIWLARDDRGRSKGYAMIHVRDDLAGRAAIAELNNQNFRGRRLQVCPARKRFDETR